MSSEEEQRFGADVILRDVKKSIKETAPTLGRVRDLKGLMELYNYVCCQTRKLEGEQADAAMVDLVVSQLRETVLLWYASNYARKRENPSFKTLWEELTKCVLGSGFNIKAFDHIQRVNQGTRSVEEYNREFGLYVDYFEMVGQTNPLTGAYVRGLKEALRNVFRIRYDTSNTEVKKAMELVLEIESDSSNFVFPHSHGKRTSDSGTEEVLKRFRGNSGRGRGNGRFFPNRGRYGLRSEGDFPSYRGSGSNTEGLGSRRSEGNSTSASFPRAVRDVECYGCGKRGHYKGDCPERKN